MIQKPKKLKSNKQAKRDNISKEYMNIIREKAILKLREKKQKK